MKRYKTALMVLGIVLLYFLLSSDETITPAENLNIPSGIGTDLIFEGNEKKYLVSASVYTFNKEKDISAIIIEGLGTNIGETRETRQIRSNQKSMLGLEKIILLNEDLAKNGIGSLVDILFSNQNISDMAYVAIVKGKALDMLKLKVSDFPTSSDYIEGLIEASKIQNFYSDNYKVLDMYVRIDAEGRSLVLPYLVIEEGKPIINGMALFSNDKMMKYVNLQETKILNILREDKVQGILSLNRGFDKFVSLYGKSERKVSCEKKDGKYSFTIDVKYKGDVVTNTIFNDLLSSPEKVAQVEKELSKELTSMCVECTKMMQEARLDCYELGRVAAAKFGRGTGVDWGQVVSESDIQINAKVEVDKFGRGFYSEKAK